VKFYLTAHKHNNQTQKCDTAVRYNQAKWLKKGNIPVKYSQPVHKTMNKFRYNTMKDIMKKEKILKQHTCELRHLINHCATLILLFYQGITPGGSKLPKKYIIFGSTPYSGQSSSIKPSYNRTELNCDYASKIT